MISDHYVIALDLNCQELQDHMIITGGMKKCEATNDSMGLSQDIGPTYGTSKSEIIQSLGCVGSKSTLDSLLII